MSDRPVNLIFQDMIDSIANILGFNEGFNQKSISLFAFRTGMI